MSDAVGTETRLARLLRERMRERGVSIRQLAEKLEITYEHARRIANGESIPSRHLLGTAADFLDLRLRELNELYTVDKVTRKFGSLPMIMTGKNPSLAPLESIWDDLTEEHQQDVIAMAQRWAGLDRHR